MRGPNPTDGERDSCMQEEQWKRKPHDVTESMAQSLSARAFLCELGNCPRRAKPRLRDMSKSSHYINNRQPITGSLSKVLSKLAVEVRVDGEDETDLT